MFPRRCTKGAKHSLTWRNCYRDVIQNTACFTRQRYGSTCQEDVDPLPLQNQLRHICDNTILNIFARSTQLNLITNPRLAPRNSGTRAIWLIGAIHRLKFVLFFCLFVFFLCFCLCGHRLLLPYSGILLNTLTFKVCIFFFFMYSISIFSLSFSFSFLSSLFRFFFLLDNYKWYTLV